MVMFDAGLTHEQMVGAYLGVFRTLIIAEVAGEISLSNSYEWLHPVCVADDETGYVDVLDRLKAIGKKASAVEGSLNANVMLGHLRDDRLCEENYLVAILTDPLYSVRLPSQEKVPVAGLSHPGVGAVLTVNDSQTLTREEDAAHTEILVSHELGHAFGLIPASRTAGVALNELYGMHCARSTCVMYSGIYDKMACHAIVRERLFCPRCVVGMLDFFLEESI
jgi:hypothetical protein